METQKIMMFLQQLKDTRILLQILYNVFFQIMKILKKTFNNKIKLPELHIDIQIRTFWKTYMKLFKTVKQNLFGKDALVQIDKKYFDISGFHMDSQLKMFAESENAEFEKMIENYIKCEKNEIKYVKIAPNIENFESIIKEIIEKEKSIDFEYMGKIIYYWLIYYKPRYINDVILNSLVKIGINNIPIFWKNTIIKMCEFQLFLNEKVMPILKEDYATKDDPVRKIFCEFSIVLRKFVNFLVNNKVPGKDKK